MRAPVDCNAHKRCKYLQQAPREQRQAPLPAHDIHSPSMRAAPRVGPLGAGDAGRDLCHVGLPQAHAAMNDECLFVCQAVRNRKGRSQLQAYL